MSDHQLEGCAREAEPPPSSYAAQHDDQKPLGIGLSDQVRGHAELVRASSERVVAVEQALQALKPGGLAIVGSFGPQGPQKCSGLPVSRYSADELHHSFGEPFQLLDSRVEQHTTPWGSQQQFVYCFCRRMACRH